MTRKAALLCVLAVCVALADTAPLPGVQRRSPDGKVHRLTLAVTTGQHLQRYLSYINLRLAYTAFIKSKAASKTFLNTVLKRHHAPLTLGRARFLLYHALRRGLNLAESQTLHSALVMANRIPKVVPHFRMNLVQAKTKKPPHRKPSPKPRPAAKRIQKLTAAQKVAAATLAAHLAAMRAHANAQKAASASLGHAAVVARLHSLGEKIGEVTKSIVSYLKRHLHLKRSAGLTAYNTENEPHVQEVDMTDVNEMLANDENKAQGQYMYSYRSAQDSQQNAEDAEKLLEQQEDADDDSEMSVFEALSDRADDSKLNDESDFAAEELTEKDADANSLFEDDFNSDLFDLTSMDEDRAAMDDMESQAVDEGNEAAKQEETSLFSNAMDKYHAALNRYHDAVKAVKHYMSSHHEEQ